MSLTTRSTMALLALVCLLSGPTGTLAAGAVDEPVTVTVHGANAAATDLLDWALGRFEAAGLGLPPLDVTFYDDRDECGGNHGSFHRRDGTAVVEICNPRPHIVLHELAHAWEAEAADDTARNRFMRELGLSAWSSSAVAWADRGIERAANLIARVVDWESQPISNAGALPRFCSYATLTRRPLPEAVPADCRDAGTPEDLG